MDNHNRRYYGSDSFIENIRAGREISPNSRNIKDLKRSDLNSSNRISADYGKKCYRNDVINEHSARNFSRAGPLDNKLGADYSSQKRTYINAHRTGTLGNSGYGRTNKPFYDEKSHHPNECGDHYPTSNQSGNFAKEHPDHILERNNPVEQYNLKSGKNYQYSSFRNAKSNDFGPLHEYDSPNSKQIRNPHALNGNKYELDGKLQLKNFEQNEDSNNDPKLIETSNIPNFQHSKKNESITSSNKSNTLKERESSATYSIVDRPSENSRPNIEDSLDEKSNDCFIGKNYDIKSTSKNDKEKYLQKHDTGESVKSLTRSSSSGKESNITVRQKKVEDIKQLNRLKSKTLSVINDGIQKLEQYRKDCDKIEPETPSKESVQSQTDDPPMKSISSATGATNRSEIVPGMCKELRKYHMQTMQSKLQLLQYLEDVPEKIHVK